MAIPSIKFTVNPQGVAVQAPSVSKVPLLMGFATGGLAAGNQNPIQVIADEGVALAEYVSGPLLEDIQAHLGQGVAQVLALRIFSGTLPAYPSPQSGAISSTSTPGTSTGLVEMTGAPMAPYGLPIAGGSSGVQVKCTSPSVTSGSVFGQFAYSLDGGITWSAPIPIPGNVATYVIPGTGITLTFRGAATTGVYATGDVWGAHAADAWNANITEAVGSVGATTQINRSAGSPQGAGACTGSGNPADEYEIVVQIISSGYITGTSGHPIGTFQASLDGGNTWGPVTPLPNTTATVGESNEITLTFSNTTGAGVTGGFVAEDQYLIPVTAPTYTSTDLANALGVAIYSPNPFGFLHVIGRPATAAAGYSEALVIDSWMATAEAANIFISAIQDMPDDTAAANVDSSFQTAFATPNLPSLRVVVGAGDINLVTPDGLLLERCVSWATSIDGALVPAGQDLAWVGAGGLPGVADILRDESVLQTLDSYGFTTARTWRGQQGFFLTNANVMGAKGTDFQYWALRRVMDEACTVAFKALQPYINGSFLADPSTGYIDARQAKRIESAINKQLYNGVVATQPGATQGDASAAIIVLNKTADIVTTGILPFVLQVVALLYGRQITVNAGFVINLANAAG